MNFQLRRIHHSVRSILRLDDASARAERNLEPGFAVARALVVLSLPLALRMEAGSGLLQLPRVLAVGFALYAASLILAFVTFHKKATAKQLMFVHILDVLWGCAFAITNQGVASVALVLIFPMLSAALRWGPSATLATALANMGILAGISSQAGIGADIRTYLAGFEISVATVLLGVLFAHLGFLERRVPAAAPARTVQQPPPLGTPSQMIQMAFDEALGVFDARQVQLLVEEFSTGRAFLWIADDSGEGVATVHSEEFDHSSGDPYFYLMPDGDWMLRRSKPGEPLAFQKTHYNDMLPRAAVPEELSKHFGIYGTVISAIVPMGDEWLGRLIICDPNVQGGPAVVMTGVREFCERTARAIHTAHLCMRACRDTAAEERARLARELHDGVIQSLLGVELSLQSLRRRVENDSESLNEIQAIQSVLKREAMALRQLVNDSRRRALRPERLLEYLSDLLERFQRDSGVVTRFFADLDKDPMSPRICYEIARIAEECVVNAQRHSKASTLTVRVGSVADSWVLVIVDDGVGFSFEGVWSLEKLISSGIGPRVIKERVQALKGDLMIESTRTGARIEISIPKHYGSSSQFVTKQRTLVPCET